MSKLFIRSQSRESIFELEEIDIQENVIDNTNNNNGYKKPEVVSYTIVANGNRGCGTYKTKERVLEIFDEICNLLNGTIIAQPKQTLKAKEKVGVVDDNKGVELKQVNTVFVYQMPNE